MEAGYADDEADIVTSEDFSHLSSGKHAITAVAMEEKRSEDVSGGADGELPSVSPISAPSDSASPAAALVDGGLAEEGDDATTASVIAAEAVEKEPSDVASKAHAAAAVDCEDAAPSSSAEFAACAADDDVVADATAKDGAGEDAEERELSEASSGDGAPAAAAATAAVPSVLCEDDGALNGELSHAAGGGDSAAAAPAAPMTAKPRKRSAVSRTPSMRLPSGKFSALRAALESGSASSSSGSGGGAASSSSGSFRCFSCGEAVYAMEAIKLSGRKLHRACFRCATCKRALSVGDAMLRDGQLFCSRHGKR
eukprot:PLAT10096.3.p1 GENE.PLAT10096.3~~PLAT10096.3.p1  ORF type:complete len:311 (+),score=117.20 PLAT10096.3:276-1208(+)